MLSHGKKFGFPYTCSNLFFMTSVLSLIMSSMMSNSFLVNWKMLSIKSLELNMLLYFDWMSMMFFGVLCMMVSCVLKFSCMYMEKDIFNVRFTWIVLSFVLSMGCLMFIPNFFFLLVGWDGLGITSFVLVMYYLSKSSLSAGLKTYLMNRMGDSFFMLGLMLFLSEGHWKMKLVLDNWLLGLLMVLGCFTKSAQFPFSSWLPAAMAAPTPVSSLVHSSTLVTAGIYLMMRFCHMFPKWLFVMMGISSLWTLYSASLAACCEFDGKKVVAYSTLSQLGLMGLAISLKLPIMSFFHLITHAMFKALMFMCVGYLMKNSGHFQDLRSLKGLWMSNPLMGITLMMSSLSLLGFPYLAGFFSKELVVENNMLMMKSVFHFLLLFSLPLTSYYSCRLLFNILHGSKYSTVSTGKDDNMLVFSILPLYMGAIMGGAAFYPWFYSVSSIYPCHLMKTMVLSLMMFGGLLSWYDVKVNKNSVLYFFGKMCFMVPFNSSFWNNLCCNSGSHLYYKMDEGMFSHVIYSLDNKLSKGKKWLFSSLKYFLSPKAGYYVFSMLCMLFFMNVVLWSFSNFSFCFEHKKWDVNYPKDLKS